MLLDTNVVSELMRPDPEPNVLRWLQARATESVYLCAVTRFELLVGVMALPIGKRRTALLKSLNDILDREFRTPCLPFDLNASEVCAELVSHRKRLGKRIAVEDAQIASIAVVHGLPLVTRNVDDSGSVIPKDPNDLKMMRTPVVQQQVRGVALSFDPKKPQRLE